MATIYSAEDLNRMVEALRAATSGDPSGDSVPSRIREEYVLRKFGGNAPRECRPEDLIEETTIILEDGEIVSVITTRPDAPPAAGTTEGEV